MVDAPPRDRDPVVIVGSGIAGLLLALHAAPSGPVLLLTEGSLGDGSTRRAQGGIAAAIGAGDSVKAHLADTLAAGAGLCDPAAAAAICGEGPRQVAALRRRGVAFDRDGARLRLAREGAHSAPRVAHAGGDATGAHIVAALARAVRAERRVEVLEGERALEVVVRDGRAAGVRAASADGAERVHAARAVALAAGGMGWLWLRTTNGPGATADGPALAMRAGAALADLELMQFHPTALALGDSPLALVSEAVRGEGAVLRDARGRRFMAAEHPLAELGPRDVVARAIARRAAEDGADPVLDLRHLDPDAVRARFPTVAAACRAHGLDLARDPVPVTPAAHYAIGGVLADVRGRSTLPGLFAVGECAATGAHGANRLASNSLLEAAVLAAGAAEVLASGRLDDWPAGPVAAPVPAPALRPEADPDAVAAAVRRTMWEGVGVERDARGLRAAAAALAALPAGAGPGADNPLAIAPLVIEAASLRTESRGVHRRRDHPATDPRQARRIAWCGGEPVMLPPVAAGDRATAREAA